MYILFLEEDLVLYAWIDDVCKNKLTIFEGAESIWISFAGLPGRRDYLEISLPRILASQYWDPS